jgi:hypothetical protein
MMNTNKYRSIYLIIFVSLAFLVAACTSEMQAATQEVQVSVPTVIVQQYVTQVVATAAAPAPTAVPAKPTAQVINTTGYDPLSEPIYYPIMGCVASRLHVGDRAFVAYGAGTNGIHYSEDIGDAPIFRRLYPGEIMEVIDGPYCERDSVVWKVFALIDEQVGFVGEGNGDYYWLLPLPPGDKTLYEQYEKDEKLRQLFSGGLPPFQAPRGACGKRKK